TVDDLGVIVDVRQLEHALVLFGVHRHLGFADAYEPELSVGLVVVSVVRDLLALAVATDVGPLERLATDPREDPDQVDQRRDLVPRRHQVGAVASGHQHTFGRQLHGVHGPQGASAL